MASDAPSPAPAPHPLALGVPKHRGSRFVTERPHGLVITRVLVADGERDIAELPREGRSAVFCPFCGVEGGYTKGRDETSPIDHFVHANDAQECGEAALQTVLHRRSREVLAQGLARLRAEGKPLRGTVECRRCRKQLVRPFLQEGSWTSETLEPAEPEQDVACLDGEVTAFFFSIHLRNREAPSAGAGTEGPVGVELDARGLFTEDGAVAWTGEGPLPLPLNAWNLERSPRSFSVCNACRRPSAEHEAMDRVIHRARATDERRGANLFATYARAAGASDVPSDGTFSVSALVSRPEALRPRPSAEVIAGLQAWPDGLETIAKVLELRRPENQKGSLAERLKDPYGAITRAIAKVDPDPDDDAVKPSAYDEALRVADFVAGNSGADHSADRFEAYAARAALKAAGFGHTGVSEGRLRYELARDLGMLQAEVEGLVRRAPLKVLARKPSIPERHVLALPLLAEAEATLARRLESRNSPLECAVPKLDPRLNAAQRQAIHTALTHRLSIVTGGPGTGKTHLLGELLRTVRRIEPKARVVFAAPTHKAVQRITEKLEDTGAEVRTVHSWLRRKDDLKDDPPWLVVVDEAGFLDSRTAQELFDVVFEAERTLLVGDPRQLPSISPGAVLRDAIAAFPELVTRLTEQMRAEDGRGLIEAAGAIASGALPREAPGVRLLSPENDAARVAFEQVAAFRNAGARPEELQVLAPTNKLVADINVRIQDKFNPMGASVPGPNRLRVGDRVVCTKTILEAGLTNGRQGYIRGLAAEGAVIEWDGMPSAVVNTDHLEAVAPAYAMTVHKSQGSEWRHVIVVLGDDNWFERSLLYTAATRAKETLVLVATEAQALRVAKKEQQRTTLLATLWGKGRTGKAGP